MVFRKKRSEIIVGIHDDRGDFTDSDDGIIAVTHDAIPDAIDRFFGINKPRKEEEDEE